MLLLNTWTANKTGTSRTEIGKGDYCMFL
uniref:Uncharacterized protein n=1 Tax=Anopheles minimus TaxID=112268 RepID=A0A182WMQ9_9DIPT